MPSTKFVIVIPDGAADEPFPALGDRTALQAARIPEMDRVAAIGNRGPLAQRPGPVPSGQ